MTTGQAEPREASRTANRFFYGLEAARGVAALMVALLHAGQSTYFDASGQRRMLVGATLGSDDFSWSALLLRVLGNGHGAVILFFVLSGFVLALVLERGPQASGPAARYFFIGRIFRIYPAAIVSLLAFVAAFLAGYSITPPQSFDPFNVLLNALLLKADINGVMWSLQLEMIAAPLIFVAFVAWRRFGFGILLMLIVLLAGLSFSGTWTRLISPHLSLGPLFGFIVGMAAYLHGRPIVARWRWPGLALTLAILGFALARPLLGWWSHWSLVFEIAFAGLIVMLLAFGVFGWTGGAVLRPLAAYYGRISYSFYLLHPLSLIVLWNMPAELGAVVAAGVPPALMSLVLFVGSVLAITPFAHLQQRIVERGGTAIGHRLQRRSLPTQRPATETVSA